VRVWPEEFEIMTRLRTVIAALGLCAVLGGCRVQEYVAAKDEVPLYSSPSCDKVVDMIPLGHHERVLAGESETGIFKVAYNGREGYVRGGDLRVLSYVHPQLDEGQDRESSVGRVVREVAVEHAGAGWSDDIRDAIRDGRVLDGMTREQVELAWGWPRTIEALATPTGGERWIYRRHGYETFEGSVASRRFHPYRADYSQNSWNTDGRYRYYRMPVVEERVVEFADKKVARSYVRRYYDVDGTTDDDDQS
jgi:hypothetical protein